MEVFLPVAKNSGSSALNTPLPADEGLGGPGSPHSPDLSRFVSKYPLY